MSSALILAYQNLITSKKITADAAQREVVTALGQLQAGFEIYHKTSRNMLSRILGKGKAKKPKGLYIYGGVGRGKSMLMDLFMQTLDAEIPARRVHFYAFMSEVQTRIKEWNDNAGDKNSDVIKFVADEISKNISVLCFDEMQISDIADAMIIGRLFSALFENNVLIVATSNRHPDELYKNGLQRERFLPFIETFKKEMNIIELKSTTDYRLQHISNLEKTYFVPLGDGADAFLDAAFAELTGNTKPVTKTIDVRGRKITAAKSSGDVALFTFGELCDAPLGSEDYIQIACQFSTILMKDIPQMGKQDYNLAIRFTKLVDELYEHKCKLICTAQVEPMQLYVEGEQSFEFQRTVSRIIEMQSRQYIESEHKS